MVDTTTAQQAGDGAGEGVLITQEVVAYCTKCRAKTVMQDPRAVTMKNGRPATRGRCPVCGAGTYRIGKLQ